MKLITPTKSKSSKGLYKYNKFNDLRFLSKRKKLYSYFKSRQRTSTVFNSTSAIEIDDVNDDVDVDPFTLIEHYDHVDVDDPFTLTEHYDDDIPVEFAPTIENDGSNDDFTTLDNNSTDDNAVLPSITITEECAPIEEDGSNDDINNINNNDILDFIDESDRLRPLLVQKFQDAGLVNFLMSKIGGSLSTKAANSVLLRTIKCLQWIFHHKKKYHLLPNKLFITLTTLIKKDYKLLSDYVSFLEVQLLLKSSTIVGVLSELVKTATWFVLFYQSTNASFQMDQSQLVGFLAVIKALRKNYRKEMVAIKTSATISTITYNMELPEASSSLEQLHKLQDAINDRLTWFNFLVQQCSKYSPIEVFDKSTYENFLRMMFAAIYVFSAQGRVLAIQDLTYADGETLYAKKEVLSGKFKTKTKYGYQPIVLATVAIQLYDFYWITLRPVFSSLEQRFPKSALWLNYDGSPCRTFGSRVTKYFLYGLGINITTNRIRSLVETAMNTLHRYAILLFYHLYSF